MQSCHQSEMFLSNSVDMMKNLQIPDKKFAKFPQPGGQNPGIKRCKQWIILIFHNRKH